ncbi:hypothetical protein DM02DRAFT_403149 [Periconia macrospinosa]|uniref:Uncharacterized protein n=1 Tax=Periconia macrospinosa TaxID=97972 RepID=A0A2V1E9A3_9PLEO|nr:hypothetical protein DM02DRAFT_403149 [Periconia macrospinosa]
MLSIILQLALAARAGDLARIKGYTGEEYLKYKDIELRLSLDKLAEFANLKATITLEYTKGYKKIRNADRVLFLQPLEET